MKDPIPIKIRITVATPTPIPAFAPVDNPLDSSLFSTGCLEPVGLVGELLVVEVVSVEELVVEAANL
jgi:hypothetical protein